MLEAHCACCPCPLPSPPQVGNDDRAAALEVTLTGPIMRFLADNGGWSGAGNERNERSWEWPGLALQIQQLGCWEAASWQPLLR